MKQTVPVLRPATDNPRLNTLIAGRWSARAIDPDGVVDIETINTLLEAARWAPSAVNNQPWRIMVTGPSDPEALELARTALTPGNSWALSAPWLLFMIARTDRPGSGKLNSRAGYEAGMAAYSMALQAAQEGLVFHQMAGFNAGVVRTGFDIPDNYEIITAIAVGRPGYVGNLPEEKQGAETAERIRKPLNEIAWLDGEAPGG